MSTELVKFYLLHPLRLLRLLYHTFLLMPLSYYRQDMELHKMNTDQKSLIAFIVPWKARPKAGYMSIISMSATAKMLRHLHHSEVILVTYVGFRTYYKNWYINSPEPVFRFSQIKRFTHLTRLLIHLPEIYAATFYDSLSARDRKFLSGIKDFHINILNQNICLMPGTEAFVSLRKLSSNITQTTAHDRYANQGTCDRYGVPLHHFSVYLDLSPYPRMDFARTKKTILLSLDKRECRSRIMQMLRADLPDYKLQTVEGMPFAEYMRIVAASKFSITFGEGFDGYLIHAAVLGRLCFAVYNEDFFPDHSCIELGNIFLSYEDMVGTITGRIRRLESDEKTYTEIVRQNMLKINQLYNYDRFLDNQNRFYRKQYDYYPEPDSDIRRQNARGSVSESI